MPRRKTPEEGGGDRSAADFLPARRSLAALRRAASHCRGCDLYRDATQTVFGEGSREARLLLVGEQPGDVEDRTGHPFVGPAGRLLDQALEEAGIPRRAVYVTNAVKHFKFEWRGRRRLHSKPRRTEVIACLPWLQAEIAAIGPACIVCLGATASQALLGAAFRLSRSRGVVLPSAHAPGLVATVHPSSILRAPDSGARHREYRRFVADLAEAARFVGGEG
jgi:DNA polymerase